MSFSQKKLETLRTGDRGQNNVNPKLNGLFPVKICIYLLLTAIHSPCEEKNPSKAATGKGKDKESI